MKEKVTIPLWLFLIGFITIPYTVCSILNGIIDIAKLLQAQ
jgi:hypothetical protein